MSTLKLALLGAPQATLGEKSIAVESRKTLALMFYLAVTRTRHSRDRLATMLWPEQDQARARAGLRHAIWLLRNAGLEPWLVMEQDALELRSGYWCDVHLFEAAVDAGRLAEALALYRDDFLAGFSLRDCPEFDRWQFMQAEEYRRQLAGLFEAEVQHCTEQGEYARGLEYARRWLALDPLHEPVHRHLMQLYAYSGQQATALRQYEECVRLLDEELGVSPEESTTTLYHAIKSRQLAPPTKARATTSESTAGAAQPPAAQNASPSAPAFHNLPTQLSPFVGREDEIDELQRILSDVDCRLVTITGPGGIGKTRLAVQVARRFVAAGSPISPFTHGVLFAGLSAVDSASGIIAAIAEAGGIALYRNVPPKQQLLQYLHDKEMLLLLDNFEHLLAESSFILEILSTAPGITILVTSREPLNVQGEWQWGIGGLPFPDAPLVDESEALGRDQAQAIEPEMAEKMLRQYAALRLFVQSARRVQPDFSLAAEYEHVAHICRLTGGMPLAIELAAAWLKLLPAAKIAREIERDLSFLTTRLRNIPDRHRSIQTVFEHSWRLLSPAEQEIFKRLSIFRGGFHRRAAEQVAGASWHDLAALAEKSLLNVTPSGRYQIHELLRQYGEGKLAADPTEKQTTLERHGRYFAEFMHARLQPLNGYGQRQATMEIGEDVDNVRAAWQWALQERRVYDIYRIAGSFYYFCQLSSRFLEGEHLMQEAVASLDRLEPSTERDIALAQILNHQGWLLIRLGEMARAAATLQRSRDLYAQLNVPPLPLMGGDPTVSFAVVCLVQGDYHRAVELSEAARRVAEARHDGLNLCFALYALAAGKLALGDYDAARAHAEQACTLARDHGTRWFLAYALNRLGNIERATGNYAKAARHFQDSYAIREEFGDPEGMAVALNLLGEIAYLQEDYEKAARQYQQALAIYQKLNDRGGLATSRKGLGQVAYARREDAAARLHFTVALTIAREIQFWPLVFSLLMDVGNLLMQNGEQSLAIETLALVHSNPASEQELKQRAQQQLDAWQQTTPPALFAEAVAHGSQETLDTVLPRLFAALDTPEPLHNIAP